MPKCVCHGAKVECSFGAAPKSLIVLPLKKVTTSYFKGIANVDDFIPFLNIPKFGLCKSPLNPMNWKMAGPVPIFVPSSCIPIPIKPWAPAAKKVKIAGKPAITEKSKTMCVWMGNIAIKDPGQKTINVK